MSRRRAAVSGTAHYPPGPRRPDTSAGVPHGTDPDLLSLARADGSIVAFFSAAGATADAIERVARTNYTENSRSTRTNLS